MGSRPVYDKKYVCRDPDEFGQLVVVDFGLVIAPASRVSGSRPSGSLEMRRFCISKR
jgi:hypothetical protein